ncbi:hypothetical protein [Noviherbaspirillum massiliense]|uniref:hypothetical protein n=1 Tax=Noviherbaspirillum massiliense TaxID=1465823 RepID=UPI0005550DA4|nr:hypothetical protein [Noviherbaspirillum massiliense]
MQFFGLSKVLGTGMSALLLTAAASAGAQESGERGWWQTVQDMGQGARERVENIYDTGKLDVYFSGYAYHGRSTYTRERLHELNEEAWGLGIGKSIRNAKGNEESIFLIGISDSHCYPQIMAGYAYQWMWSVGQSGLEVGAGLAPMLVSRRDYFGGVPFPAVFPIASVGTQNFKMLASYVPRLSSNKGNGDVLFLFGKVSFD